jgi:hypothetical protein
MTHVKILVAKLSVHRALSKFRAAGYRETLPRPSENTMLSHSVGTLNGQENSASAWDIPVKASFDKEAHKTFSSVESRTNSTLA